MNTHLSAPQRPAALPDILRPLGRAPRNSLRDRIAMHIALRLLLWSTRPTTATPSARREGPRRRSLESNREAREAFWLQQAHFTARS